MQPQESNDPPKHPTMLGLNNANKTDEYTLETMIDAKGLSFVVDTICEICYAKATHIRSNYNDEALAERWEKSGFSLVNPKEGLDVEFPS